MKKVYLKDLDTIYGIILECAEWLKSKGVKQWNPPYPKNRFEKDIGKGSVYYFISVKGVIGTVTLSTKKPFYYPKTLWKSSSKTWYITKFAVPRKLKGKGIGKNLLTKIGNKAKARKIKRLGLDIPEHNKKLRNYYSSSGFVQIKKDIFNNYVFLLMEKRIK